MGYGLAISVRSASVVSLYLVCGGWNADESMFGFEGTAKRRSITLACVP